MAKYGSQMPQGDVDQSKQKSEDYRLLGGINTKVNLYSNGPAEFRDLSNLNFVSMGALSKRPGTTLFPGTTYAIGSSGVTVGVGQITGAYEFSRLNGSSYMIVASCGVSTNSLLMANIAGYSPIVAYGSTLFVQSGPAGSLWSFTTFVDHLFACNGKNFYRINPLPGASYLFNGNMNAYNYSVPSIHILNGPMAVTYTNSSFTLIGPTVYGAIYGITGIGSASGYSGNFVFSLGFINDRGFIGPVNNGVTISLNGSTISQIEIQIAGNTLLYGYGITAMVLYQSVVDGVNLYGYTQAIYAGKSQPGGTLVYTFSGTSFGALPFGAIAQSQDYDVTQINSGLIPRYLEVYNNQLFMAGFSTAPSTFFWSDIAEPEGVQPDFSVEVRTNDGDRVTGMRAYLGSLVITKQRSVHVLSGDNPSNFLLQELTDQYGCLSHRCLLVWNNVLWFLDSKGIMEYNGAGIKCVSNKVESIFNNMNQRAAIDNACAIHVKQFNELWFAIPANGSATNNMIVVYDYVADSWTHYDGIQAQTLFSAYGGFTSKKPFYGGYTGGLMYFDPTLTSDNDQGITCSFQSIFFSARGQSVQNQYRRFYLDVNPVLGFTQAINMTFQQDFGTTIQVSRTIYQNPFQSRVDFGISARSIQASMSHYSASLPLVINGFTIESRLQRNV